jgi:hypothetical protein
LIAFGVVAEEQVRIAIGPRRRSIVDLAAASLRLSATLATGKSRRMAPHTLLIGGSVTTIVSAIGWGI